MHLVNMRAALAGIDLLLIDGNNLLHRLSGGVDPGALRLLLAKLRGALPAETRATLMLDGHPASGTDRRQRVQRGLEIHHSGSLTADDALLNIIRDQGHQARAGVVLVSDDRALVERARNLGARTQRLAWLEQWLANPGRPDAGATGATGIGAGRPRRPRSPGSAAPPTSAAAEALGDEPEREPWKPGRGATRKKGNPRRRPG